MRLLLDTYLRVWMLDDSPKLGQACAAKTSAQMQRVLSRLALRPD